MFPDYGFPFNKMFPKGDADRVLEKNLLAEQFWASPRRLIGRQWMLETAFLGQRPEKDLSDPYFLRKAFLSAAAHAQAVNMLGHVRAAKHPTWAAILFFTRRTTEDLGRFKIINEMRMYADLRAAKDEYVFYKHFEMLTDQEVLPISTIRHRVKQLLGVDMGPKARRAAEILGVPIK